MIAKDAKLSRRLYMMYNVFFNPDINEYILVNGYYVFYHSAPIEAMENCTYLLHDKSMHGLALRHFDLFSGVNYLLFDVRR